MNPPISTRLAGSVEKAYAAMETKPDILVCLIPRDAGTLFAAGRPLSLPMRKDLAVAEGTAGLGGRSACFNLPVPIRPRGMAETLYGRSRGRTGANRARRTSPSSLRRFPPIASRRWKRSTKRSRKASKKQVARVSPISLASTTMIRTSRRLGKVIEDNLKGWLD